MKKGLGLQANISGFNTTLPQTKHLNFFMGTNPVGYANGGAVRRGIPSSNMNVTQGFLPMALGFENGGDVSMYNAVVKTIAKYIVATQDLFKGKSENDPEVLQEAEKIAQTQPEIAQAISTGIGEYAEGVPAGGGKEPPMPTETIKEPDKKINFGDMLDDLNNIIQQKEKDFLDQGLDAFVPDPLIEFRDNLLGPEKIQTDIGEYRFPQPDSVEQTPKKEESKKDEKSIIDKGLDIIEDAIYKDDDKPSKKEDKKDEKTITAEPDETDKPVDSGTSGITSIMDSGARKEFSKKEAKDASKGIADLTGNKGKKDIPEWALPLASAGFAMMASKSPYFLQALGEAGQEGIKTLATQKELEQDKLDKEAERAFLEARTEQIGRPDAPFKIGNAFYRYDENNKLVKVRNIQRSLTEIEDDLRTRIVGYDNLPLKERQELVKKEELSDQNILYQGETTEATTDKDRNLIDSLKEYIGL